MMKVPSNSRSISSNILCLFAADNKDMHETKTSKKGKGTAKRLNGDNILHWSPSSLLSARSSSCLKLSVTAAREETLFKNFLQPRKS